MQGSSCILAGLTLAHSGLSDPCGALTQYILWLLVFFLCLFLWLTIASLDLMQSSLSLHYEACYHICFIHRISVLTKPRWFIMQKSSLLTDAVTPPWLSHSLKDWNTSTTCRRHVSEQEYPAPLSQESSQRHTFTITHSFHNSPSSSCKHHASVLGATGLLGISSSSSDGLWAQAGSHFTELFKGRTQFRLHGFPWILAHKHWSTQPGIYPYEMAQIKLTALPTQH